MICHRCRGITFIIPPVYPPTTGGVNDYGRTQGKHFCKNSPRDYSCDGRDMSPEIDIGGVNAKITKSHAILVNHPDAPCGGFVHWIAWDMELVTKIPEKIPKIPVFTFPFKAVQGKNSFWKNRVQRSVSSPWADAQVFLYSLWS